MAEHILVLRVAGANYNKLRIIVDNPLNHIINKIQALLVSQTGNQTNHVTLLVHCQAKLFLQFLFIHELLLTVV